MSTLTVQNIQGSSSSSNTINVASGHKISGAAGSIVAPGQVIQTVSNSNGTGFTTTSTSYINLISVQITPKFSNSKILITGTMFVSHRDYYDGRMKLVFDSGSGNTDITLGSAKAEYMVRENGHPSQNFSTSNWGQTAALYGAIPYVLNFEHSPNTTNQITYLIQAFTSNASQTFYFNRGSTSTTDPLHISTIIAQEIAQ
jgi:hypothetical protein